MVDHQILSTGREKYISQVISNHINAGIYNYRQDLLGKVLTVIDAAFTDPQQRKAVKDLINGIFYNGSYMEDTNTWYIIQSLAIALRNKRSVGEHPDEHEAYICEFPRQYSDNLVKELEKLELG